MMYSQITGTGGYLPEKVLTNFDFEKIVETSNDWIVERTGIHQRHVAEEYETSLSMAEHAGRIALDTAGILPKDLGMIIIATTTAQKVFPSTSCLLQERLGIGGCPAFDLNSTACAGFMYGVSIADLYIKQGIIKHALVIGSELATRVIDWSDRATCILFGDGAGAVVLSASKEPGILSTHLHADGNHKDILYLDSLIGQERTYMKMSGNQLFKIAVNVLGDLFDETLEANGIKKSDINWLVPHQANLRIIQAMAKKLELPMDRVIVTLDKQANTSSASIPLALDQGIRDGRIKHGEMLLLEGIGGGLAWGSALVRY
jgi:3-oxoacyl-[acyl-carrier-protein] synthase-3